MLILAGNPEKSFQRNVTVLYFIFGLFALFALYLYMMSVFFHPTISFFIFGSLFFHGMVIMAIIRLYKIFKYASMLKNKPYVSLYLIIFILILLLLGLSCLYCPAIFYGCFVLEIKLFTLLFAGLGLLEFSQAVNFINHT